MIEEVHQAQPFTPCTGVHSVKETSVGIFVSEVIEDFNGLIEFSRKNQVISNVFPASQPLLKEGIDRDSNAEIQRDNANLTGFVLAKLNPENSPTKSFQGVNENHRQYFSFHEKSYVRWAPFKTELISILQAFSPLLDKYQVNGIALTYIDEYKWHEGHDIDYNQIFKRDNQYMPSIFFQKENSSAELNSTMKLKKDDYLFFVRLNIQPAIETEGSFLRIIHNAVYISDETSMEGLLNEENNSFSTIIQAAHELNKDLMKELLLPGVIQRINMT